MKRDKGKKIAGAFRLLGAHQPMYFAYMAPLVLVTAAIPLISVGVPKLIIEFLTEGRKYRDILAIIGLYSIILVAANVMKHVLTYGIDMQIEQFKYKLQLKIGRAAMGAKLKDIENAAYKEEILMAGNVTGLSDIMTILQNLFSAAITIFGLACVIVRINIVFFLLVGVTLSIKIILSLVQFRLAAEQRVQEAANNKVGRYLDSIQYSSEGAAKELRVNNAQNWLFGKITSFRERMLEIQFRAFGRYRLFEALQLAAVGIQNVSILIILAGYYVEGSISIGDFTLYFSAITLLSTTLSRVTDELLSFSQKLLYCGDYNKVVGMEQNREKAYGWDKEQNQCKGVPFGLDGEWNSELRRITKIKFEKVSFSYPGTRDKVLEEVSFELHCGDRAMLVGKNGSGKTTIIKLLCKFYEPDSGKIYVNDTDISTISNQQYYDLIAGVFQDFSMFAFPINENISMRSEEETDAHRLWSSLGKVELKEVVESLKEQEHTYITRLFSESGVDFSGGEKQRMGIARAVYKDAPILILDEPAANLDVKMEEELYGKFYEMTEGKISLTVSHRLSQASACNKIYVLDHGVICEKGTHHELMEKDGIYAAMFRKQQEAYVMQG